MQTSFGFLGYFERDERHSAVWQMYDPGLFVSRQDAFSKLQGLLGTRTRDAKRLISLVAPPGLGKTWLLNYTRQQFANERAILWIDIPQFMAEGAKGMNYDALKGWLIQAVTDIAPKCRMLGDLKPDEVEVLMLLEQVVEYLCDRCVFEQPPVVLVDGYDSYDEGVLGELEEHILGRLLSKQCMKMIICHRDDQRPLLRLYSQHHALVHLNVFADDPTSPPSYTVIEQQFENLRKRYFGSIKTTSRAMTTLPIFSNYRWNHPFINAFLSTQFLLSTSESKSPPLRHEQIQACCLELINRPNPTTGEAGRHPVMTVDDIATLTEIAWRLPRQWTILELEKEMNLKFHFSEFKKLFECRAIVSCEQQKVYHEYRVADGLHELLVDLKSMGGGL